MPVERVRQGTRLPPDQRRPPDQRVECVLPHAVGAEDEGQRNDEEEGVDTLHTNNDGSYKVATAARCMLMHDAALSWKARNLLA